MTMIIDVRTPEEYAAGHIEGAVNVPVESIIEGDLGALAGIPEDTEVRLYCRSGARSSYACEFLKSNGFSNVVNLGGLEDAARALAE